MAFLDLAEIVALGFRRDFEEEVALESADHAVLESSSEDEADAFELALL